MLPSMTDGLLDLVEQLLLHLTRSFFLWWLVAEKLRLMPADSSQQKTVERLVSLRRHTVVELLVLRDGVHWEKGRSRSSAKVT